MRDRKTLQNIERVKEEVASLQTNSNEVLKKAMQGHSQLNKFRKFIPEDYMEKTKDLARLDICLLNDYLNKYTEKLSRGTSQDQAIALDQLNFTTVFKGVEKKTFNPYLVYYSQKQLARRMNIELLRSENPRYMN